MMSLRYVLCNNNTIIFRSDVIKVLVAFVKINNIGGDQLLIIGELVLKIFDLLHPPPTFFPFSHFVWYLQQKLTRTIYHLSICFVLLFYFCFFFFCVLKIEEKPQVSGKVVKTSAGRKKNSSRSEGDTSNPEQLKQATKPEKVRNQLIDS